jgi:hypothetical protein
MHSISLLRSYSRGQALADNGSTSRLNNYTNMYGGTVILSDIIKHILYQSLRRHYHVSGLYQSLRRHWILLKHNRYQFQRCHVKLDGAARSTDLTYILTRDQSQRRHYRVLGYY